VDDEQERAKPLGVILSSEVHGVRTSWSECWLDAWCSILLQCTLW